MRSPLIVHHDDEDGICGALTFWLATDKQAELIPAEHGDAVPPDEIFENRAVFIVDFSYPREVLKRIDDLATKLVLLDHHKSAEQACKGLPFAHFDMQRSGARMAFDYVTQDAKMVGPLSKDPDLMDRLDLLSRYVQDRDLWTNELEHTEEVTAWLRSFPKTIDAWYRIAQRFPHQSVQGTTDFDEIITEGEAILRRQKQDINWLLSLHRKGTYLSDDKILRVALVNSPLFASDIGHRLIRDEDIDFACIYSVDKSGKYVYQLRSDTEQCDVSKIAKKFGGGGHKRASGFRSLFTPDVFFDDES